VTSLTPKRRVRLLLDASGEPLTREQVFVLCQLTTVPGTAGIRCQRMFMPAGAPAAGAITVTWGEHVPFRR
jgi:hypothetical protein